MKKKRHQSQNDPMPEDLSGKEGRENTLPRTERLRQIKKRLREGFYHSRTVADRVAERLLSDPAFTKSL